jgi:hypothetical protein
MIPALEMNRRTASTLLVKRRNRYSFPTVARDRASVGRGWFIGHAGFNKSMRTGCANLIAYVILLTSSRGVKQAENGPTLGAATGYGLGGANLRKAASRMPSSHIVPGSGTRTAMPLGTPPPMPAARPQPNSTQSSRSLRPTQRI